MKTIALTLWDEKQCVRSLIAICQLVKTNDLTFVLANLGRSTERFYERALDPVYQSELTATENLALEREFAALCDWIQNGKESIPKHNMQITTKLQVGCNPEFFSVSCVHGAVCTIFLPSLDQHSAHCSLYFGENK